MSETFSSPDEAATEAIGRMLAERLDGQGVVLVYGELGAGKTVLARGLAAAIGVDPSGVRSPSFTLVNEHEGSSGRMVHVDLYRLTPAEAEAMGIDEVLATPGMRVVEWAERLPAPPPRSVSVWIERAGRGVRTIRVKGLPAPGSPPAMADSIPPG